ncbi:MAG TPA: hypothetical protein VGI28_17240 [Stellaceae bacterium]|jgi:hypothetical protein
MQIVGAQIDPHLGPGAAEQPVALAGNAFSPAEAIRLMDESSIDAAVTTRRFRSFA